MTVGGTITGRAERRAERERERHARERAQANAASGAQAVQAARVAAFRNGDASAQTLARAALNPRAPGTGANRPLLAPATERSQPPLSRPWGFEAAQRRAVADGLVTVDGLPPPPPPPAPRSPSFRDFERDSSPGRRLTARPFIPGQSDNTRDPNAGPSRTRRREEHDMSID